MKPHAVRTSARTGFTLVELLVVIAIMAALGALLVMFYPSVSSQAAEANGAANLQGWLNIARQTAIRNQNPSGLRLWIQTQNLATLQVTQCSYIEQPEDFSGGTLITPGPNSTTVLISGADVTGGFSSTGNSALYAVQSGDYLEVLGSGLMHSIAPPTAANPNPVQFNGAVSQLSLSTPVPFQVTAAAGTGTPNYRILRAPRVLGQDMLTLPGGVVVDLQTNTTYGNFVPITPTYVPSATGPVQSGGYVDVLFSPTGAVLLPRVPQAYLAFWVRQPDITNPANVFAGNPTIIAVFGQTGLVGAYAPAPTNPYIDIY